jgi:hypothetical protein
MENLTYVDAGSWQEFLKYQEGHPERNCVYIADETFLRGKNPGRIVRIGTFEDRWNFIAISEMIERAEIEWEDFFTSIEIEIEMEQKGLSDKDIEYGI